MRTSPRLFIQGLLIGALLATQTSGVAAAQIPTPTPIETSPVDTVGGVVDDVTGTVNDTVGQVTEPIDTVTGGGGRLPEPVETVVDAVSGAVKDAGGAANDATGGTTGNATNNVNDAVAGAATQANDAGSAAGTTEGTAASGAGVPRSYSSVTGGSLQGWAKARGLFNLTSFFGTSQPSLAILVDAVNDADGDGIFSDSESAPEPGVDVSFKAAITNIGSTNFEIAGVSHSYAAPTGPAQAEVCAELVGIMLAPGETLACSFPVSGYAPARGESLVNTVMAAGFEVGKGARRGASDSDGTTVETLVPGDEVLAVAIKRNLAFTGTHAARLLALGLVLLAMGATLIALARARSRRPDRPLPAESSAEFLGWWTARPETRRMKEKAHRK